MKKKFLLLVVIFAAGFLRALPCPAQETPDAQTVKNPETLRTETEKKKEAMQGLDIRRKEDYLIYQLIKEKEHVQEEAVPDYGENGYLAYHFRKQTRRVRAWLLRRAENLEDALMEKCVKLKKENPRVFAWILCCNQTAGKITGQTRCFFQNRSNIFWGLFLGIYYILFCLPLMMIARKLRMKHVWMAWIPILQAVLLVRMAGKSFFSFLFLLVPLINVFVFIGLWRKIAEFLQKPLFLGILMIIPGINLLVIWFLACSRTR